MRRQRARKGCGEDEAKDNDLDGRERDVMTSARAVVALCVEWRAWKLVSQDRARRDGAQSHTPMSDVASANTVCGRSMYSKP